MLKKRRGVNATMVWYRLEECTRQLYLNQCGINEVQILQSIRKSHHSAVNGVTWVVYSNQIVHTDRYGGGSDRLISDVIKAIVCKPLFYVH